MYLTVTLRKEVDTIEQGQQLYEIVKQKMADHPDVKVGGGVSSQFTDEE